MSAQNFFDRYINKFVDSGMDNYRNQCVDLIQVYCREELNLPLVPGNAKDWFNNADSRFYEKIKNTYWVIPKIGDIVVFGEAVGAYGHIAIIKTANLFNFVSFDQNWPLNTPAHFQNHNYNGVIGFLRPKIAVAPVVPQNNIIKIRVDKAVANVRTAPNLSAPLGGSRQLVRGDVFEATEIITGETVYGISQWAHSRMGNYVHMSGLTKL